MNLKPVNSTGGRWVFLLNDTNLAMTNETQMPYLHEEEVISRSV